MLQRRLTRLGEVFEHIAVLLAQRIATGSPVASKLWMAWRTVLPMSKQRPVLLM